MGIVFDIVQINGPKPVASYPPNSRILVGFHPTLKRAESQCERFNTCRFLVEEAGFCFLVEEHDEESTRRAMPYDYL